MVGSKYLVIIVFQKKNGLFLVFIPSLSLMSLLYSAISLETEDLSKIPVPLESKKLFKSRHCKLQTKLILIIMIKKKVFKKINIGTLVIKKEPFVKDQLETVQ